MALHIAVISVRLERTSDLDGNVFERLRDPGDHCFSWLTPGQPPKSDMQSNAVVNGRSSRRSKTFARHIKSRIFDKEIDTGCESCNSVLVFSLMEVCLPKKSG